jgi:serine phosphatase RsbU (regulator of sigma subunit)
MSTDDQTQIASFTDEEAVWRLARALASSLTPYDVAEAVAQEGGAAAGGSFANMAVLESQSGRVSVMHHSALASGMETYDLTAQVPACDAIRSGLPVLLASVGEVGDRYPHLLAEIQAAGLSARASVPLRSANGTTLGAAGFGWPAPQSFSAAQLRRIDLIAQLTGLALERTIGQIDDRRNSELQRSLALDEAKQANARLRTLATLSADLTGVGTQAEIYHRVSLAVVESLADWCTVVVPVGEELVRVAGAHRDPVLDGLAKRLVGAYPHHFSGPSPGVVAYRNADQLTFDHLAQDIIADLDDSVASAAYGRTLQILGDGPGLITPIMTDDQVAAVLTMARGSGPKFTEDDAGFVRELARTVASFLDDARHVETQRDIATALQDAALPKTLPSLDGVKIAAGYRAATAGIQVGGDWYDAFELQPGRIALVVGDVAGHGVQAAAVMAQMRNALRAHLFTPLGLAESLNRLSRLLATQEPDAFATIICIEIDSLSGELTWASAGHPAPILVSGDGTSAHLHGHAAPPVGWMHINASREATEHQLTLKPGDRVLLFTDGLIERRGIDLGIGLAHLMIQSEQTRGLGPEDACETILRDVLAASHEDDVCLMIADFGSDL